MSFSSNVKEELSRNETSARHCRLAELAGFLKFCGDIRQENGHYRVQIHTEMVYVAKRFYTLIKKVFNMQAKIEISRNDFLKVEIIQLLLTIILIVFYY